MDCYSKTYTLLTSVNNDLDNADDADNTDDYNRVIGISKCEHPTKHTHQLTNPPIQHQTHTDIWIGWLQ